MHVNLLSECGTAHESVNRLAATTKSCSSVRLKTFSYWPQELQARIRVLVFANATFLALAIEIILKIFMDKLIAKNNYLREKNGNDVITNLEGILIIICHKYLNFDKILIYFKRRICISDRLDNASRFVSDNHGKSQSTQYFSTRSRYITVALINIYLIR